VLIPNSFHTKHFQGAYDRLHQAEQVNCSFPLHNQAHTNPSKLQTGVVAAGTLVQAERCSSACHKSGEENWGIKESALGTAWLAPGVPLEVLSSSPVSMLLKAKKSCPTLRSSSIALSVVMGGMEYRLVRTICKRAGDGAREAMIK
jgi:hypothetical protein